ncbi:MAG: NlpC/P60 family protein [Eubacteriales bacterium]|nr:NlpC/P60 family protein [Eubacteriales bacterium]
MSESKKHTVGVLVKSAQVRLYIALAGIGVLLFYPVRNTLVRLLFVFLMMAAWACVLYLSRSKRKIRYAIIGLTLFAVLFCCMPERRIDEGKLREEYVRSLLRYELKPYIWGGESFFAVDCSGLIRQGFVDANLIYGLKTLDGACVRKAILLWWQDASAKAMRDEDRGQTKRLMEAVSINELDQNLVRPGDFAVTQSGVHCLAYLGEGNWIQADPSSRKVTIGRVPVDSGWFMQQVYIMRWGEFGK